MAPGAEHKAFAWQERGIKADVRHVPLRAGGVVRAEGLRLGIYTGAAVERQKRLQPSPVVIVPVGQDGGIHRRKVDPQLDGVFGEQAAGTRIKQQAVLIRLYMEAQPMLTSEGLGSCRVFR